MFKLNITFSGITEKLKAQNREWNEDNTETLVKGEENPETLENDHPRKTFQNLARNDDKKKWLIQIKIRLNLFLKEIKYLMVMFFNLLNFLRSN